MAKQDPVKKLIEDATNLVTENKSIVLGALVGYLASDILEKKPEIRNAILGALAGNTDVKKLLSSGSKDEE
ncbi:MAG: hypothetical protein NC218_03630 [Acetobacter sp.]|nr:hypothetical protein [Acetobacter sp.]